MKIPNRSALTSIWILIPCLGCGLANGAEGQTLGYSVASDRLVELNLETGDFSVVGSRRRVSAELR
jgi:hypothetical protein